MVFSPSIFNDKDYAALATIAVRVRINETAINGRGSSEKAGRAQKGISGASEEAGSVGEGFSTDTTGRRTFIPRSIRGRAPRALTPEDLLSESFLNWFGNSEAVDVEGEPIIFYHCSLTFWGWMEPNGSRWR
jgi:hypothetical protein